MNNQQAINLLKNLEQSLDDYCGLNDEGETAFRMAIAALELFGNAEQLPAVQPELKKGKWIPVCGNKQCNCSVCNEGYDHTFEFIEKWNYCPNCGAKMEVEHDDISG